MPTDPNSYRSFTDALKLAYSNPDGVSDETLNRFYDTADYLEEDSDPQNNEFSYSQFLTERNKEVDRLKTSSEDETLYGFIPTDWLPDWVKHGYNSSITGLSGQIASGEQKFNLGEYEPEMLEDIGATIISFLQPLDLATMLAGGGVGGLAAKQVFKTGVKEALKKGLSKTATKKIIANK